MREKSKKTVRTRLLALLLVFCMTFQMVAYSPGKVVRAEGEETGVSEALDDEGLSLPENTPENDPGDAIVEPETEVIEKETVQPTDWTVQTEGLKLTLAGISCQKGDEEPADLETVENRWDLSALNPEDAGQLILTWQYAFAEDVALNRGDSFSISMPKTAEGKAFIELKDTEAPAALTDSQDNEIGSYTIKENTATVTLNEAAAESAEAVSGTLELSGTLNAEALKTGEATDATLAPQGEAGEQWTLVLPGKTEAETTPELAPTTEPEQKKENPVMNGLKALFGVQERAGTPEGPQDVTNETGQLGLSFDKLSYTDTNDVVYNVQKVDDKFDLSGVTFENIKGLSLGLNFKIMMDDENRAINKGDQFHFDIPEGLVPNYAAGEMPNNAILKFQGIEIAKYSIVQADEQNTLVVTFTDNVNKEEGYTSIMGGFNIQLAFDKDKLNGNQPKEIQLQLQQGGVTSTIVAPPTIATVNGIEKTGTFAFDASNRTIIWEVKVGTDLKSAGVPLKGLQITDTFNPAELTYQSASINGNDITFAENNGNYTYTFPDDTDLKAPQTIQIKTEATAAAVSAANSGNKIISNQVSMSVPRSTEIQVGTEHEKTGNVTIPQPKVEKQGMQIDSDTIKWSIRVNDAGGVKNYIWDAIVTDEMYSGLVFRPGTLTLTKEGGTPETVPVVNKGGTEPTSGNYAVYDSKPNADNNNKAFKFYFKEPNPISDIYTIEFETGVDHDTFVGDQPSDKEELQNKAMLEGRWPGGDGPGLGHNWLLPIGTGFNTAVINKDVANTNTQTGEITWKLRPSTRTDSFSTATITDAIEDDQEFDQDSVVIKKGTGTFDAEALKKVLKWDDTAKKLTFVFNKEDYSSINDIEITYKTKAVNFFKENYTDHTYQNKADLAVVDGAITYESSDTAKTVLKNEFLTKGTLYEPAADASSENYMKYTIIVNKNKMALNNVVVEDDLSQLKTNVLNMDGNLKGTLDTSAWEIDKNKTEVKIGGMADDEATKKINDSISGTMPKVTANLGSISDTYEINLYLKLTETAKAELGKGDCILQTENKATAKADELNSGTSFDVTSKGTGDTDRVINKLADKSNLTPDGEITEFDWQVKINPNGAVLNNDENTPVTIEDTIPKGLEFDLSSVKLIKADGAELTKGTDYDITQNQTDDQTTLVITFKGDKKFYNNPLTLTYTTNVISQVSGNKVQNKAVLKVGSDEISSSQQSENVENGAWAYLQRMASFKYTKYDSATNEGKPLPGAEFELYSDQECTQLLKQVTSDANGEFTFWGLEVNEDYYFKELKAPEGYELDLKTYTITNDGQGGLHSGGDLKIYNNRTVTSNAVEFEKSYNGKDDTYKNSTVDDYKFQSTFKLWLYPMDSPTKVAVNVTENSEGSYSYASAGVNPENGQTTELVNGESDGKITITGLPWGSYALEEVKAAEGYAATKGLQKFKIDKEKKSVTWDNGSSSSLTNHETEIKVSKIDSNKNAVTGAELTIYKDSNGTQGTEIVTVPLTKEKLQWTTGSPNNPKTIKGLPAGTYWLVETELPASNLQVAQAQPIKFTIDAYGTLNGGNGVDGNAKTIKMTDAINKVTVKKLDQFGKSVKGLTADTLQLKENSSVVSTSGSPDNDKYVQTTLNQNSGAFTFTGLKRGSTYVLEETTAPANYLKANAITFTINNDGSIDSANGSTDKWNLNNDSGAPANLDGMNFTNTYDNNNTLTLRDERIAGHVTFTKWDKNKNLDESNDDTALPGVKFELYKKGESGGSDTKITKDNEYFVSEDATGVVTTVGSSLINQDTGEFFSRGLLPGNYYFKEVETHGDFVMPEGDDAKSDEFTILEKNRYTWKVLEGDIKKQNIIKIADMYNTPLRTDIVLRKTDADTTATTTGVVGAVYGLYSDQACTQIVKGGPNSATERKVTTGTQGDVVTWTDTNNNSYTHTLTENGQAYFCDVSRGKYWIKEISPAPGYTLSTEVGSVEVTNNNSTTEIPVPVTNTQTEIKLKKVNSENSALQNAQFTITPVSGKFFKDGSASKTLKPETSEDFLKGQLIAGDTYTISETALPAGYTKIDDFTIKVENNGNITVDGNRSDVTTDNTSDTKLLTIKDTETSFKFQKIDQFGDNVSGAALELSGSFVDAASPISWNTSDNNANPKAIAGELIAGNPYTLKEATTPDGYQTAPEVTFTVSADGKSLTVNTPTGDNRVALADNSVTLKLTDRKVMGHAQLTKTDSDNPSKKLEGVTFELYKKSAPDTLIAELKTDTGGVVTTVGQTGITNQDTNRALSDGLSKGAYYFKEKSTLNNYVLDTEPVEFTVDSSKDYYNNQGTADTAKLIPITMTNTLFKATVKLQKLDATSKAGIGNVAFTLSKKESNDSYTPVSGLTELKTTQDGNLTFEVHEKGSYKLTETVLAGYTENSKFEATFDLTDNCHDQTLEIKNSSADKDPFKLQKTAGEWNASGILNTRQPATFTLEKIDSQNSSTKLNGAKFELYKKTGGSFETDKTAGVVLTAETGKTYDCSKTTPTETNGTKGQLVLNNLPWGDYWIIETAPPAGYQLPENNPAKDFTVGATALDVKWISDSSTAITNDQNSLTLNKVKVDGISALSGATLEVTDEAGKKIGETTLNTSADSWTITGALTARENYYLNETTVPDGYEAPAKKDDTKGYLAQIQLDNSGEVSIIDNNMTDDFITIGTDSKSITLKNQPIEVSFGKTDMDDNALTGAKFEITGTFADGTSSIEITDSNADTALKGKLIAGEKYTVKETTPPKGYKIAPEFVFTVKADGTVTLPNGLESYVSATQNDQTNTASQITVKDDLVKTRIKKTDEAGQPIDGAEFTIEGYFKDNSTVKTKQTVSPTATDAAEILNLIESSSKGNPDHIYTLEETRAADGYQRVTEKAEFFICPQAKVHFKPESGISGVTSTDSDEITMTFKDKPIKLGLNKTDENGAALAGVTFNLTGKFADNPSTEATKELTSDNGTYHLDKILIAGESYTLKETAAPPKYQIYENGVKIQVSDDGKNITIEGNHDGISLENNILTFKDKLKLGNIIFDKKAIDSEDDTEPVPRDGVTFGLYTDPECVVPVTRTEGGKPVAVTAVSGQDGKVQFTDIPAGVYYIKEMGTDAVNAYYKANNRVYKADIDGSQPANTGGAYGITLADNTAIDNTVINTAVRGDIILKKIDDTFKTTDANGNETDLALSGAQFAVCLKGTKTVVAGITEKAETPGEYALQPVTQITLGDGYTIKLQNDFNIPYLYDNKLLAGEYDIYETAAPGGYIAPDNIVAELHIAEMTTTIGGEAATQAIITNQIRRSAVSIEKQIETTAQGSIEVETAKAGTGYQFKLERVMEADGKTPARFGYTATAATKDNGKAEFENVPVGQYQITETAVSGLTEPYVLPGSQTITVREDGSVDNGGKQNQFTNTLKRGSITGVKTDTDTRADKTYPVKGAVIGLFKDSQKVAEATTDENGAYRFDNIPYGSYTLKEIAAPAGYVLNDTQTIDVKVIENGQEVKASTSIANTLMKGSLTLLKTSADSQKLAGAEFTLTGKNNYGDDITPIVKATGSDGLAVFENLPLGSYTLTETRQPDGYERLDESLDVSVTAGSNNIAQVSVSQNGEAMKPDSDSQYTLVNKAAEIVFNKTGHIGELCANGENAGDYLNATKPLEGAKFGLYTQDNQLVKEAVSNDGGQVVFDHVTPGTYLVKELEAPHCYKVDANAYLAVVDETGRFNGLKAADGSSLKDNTILDDAVRGKIKLIKVDEQNPDKRLPGSTYGLYKRVEKQSRNPFARFFRAAPQYDEILIATGVTDENGEILFDGLLTGVEYIVKELAAPAGSQVSEKPIVVKFKLEEGETEPIVEKSDNGSGTADVDKDGNIIWYEPPIMVEVSKKDTNEKMLSGAKLRITEDENKDGIFEPVKDENGDALEWLSSSEPERIANLLKADIDYRLEEIESPAGYTLAEPIDFNVTVKNVGPDENFVDKITMTDTLTALSISKTAINGTDELPGAVLTVYEAAEDGSIARDEAGNEIVAQTITGESLSWTSGTEMKKIEGLKKGTYILREITAPDGYEVAEEITFTLMPDGTVAVGGKACEGNIVRMQDKPVAENGTPGVPDKPQTAAPNNPDVNSGAATGIAGSVSPTTFWGVLALLSVAALLVCSIVVWRRKRW